ncbi:type VI secretion system Vgr family protein [Chondromyces crocatus]|uniref:Gp5/Type VI secretion system Vgr protein OB-fold domain-containing protein n=1 Tax=Chondromyces crocatus TaxID=52 RepID=A0A0K1EI38_CHOCO|nr:type VI secretion system tip protein TssI/VgrG [Chondromyces crocatus]AKT40248.1 uncharacterized protein CMC5_044010 [Chondromyces crocatus]
MTQIDGHVRFESDGFPEGLLEIAKLDGREAIGKLFEFELLLVYQGEDEVDPEEILGCEATLVFERNGEEIRRVHGMIAEINDRLDTETDHATFSVLVVPRAYRLTLLETLDVFLDTTVPDIIRQKLEALGMKGRGATPAGSGPGSVRAGHVMAANEAEEPYDFDLRLHAKYPRRELIVQYKETDLAFLSRLCEHLGISIFFEHQNGRDVMVFADDASGFTRSDEDVAVPFRPRGDRCDIFRLEEKTRMIPGQFVVRDYNYRTPQVTLTGVADVPHGQGAVVEYGAHVKTPEEAAAMAKIRAEERLAWRRVFEGSSGVPQLAPGSTFTLDGHGHGNLDLLVLEMTHRAALPTKLLGEAPGEPGYTNDFKAIRKARPFRPARVTPKPRIHGVATGIIDAQEDSEYAKVDDQGRYLVRFVFDTHTPEERQASRWVRMAQPHAGPGYGMHFPLRPGVEVLLTFVDGDPDRPIIAATVPNPQTASPVTSNNAPRNIIRTGSGNEINIDDTKDEQRIKLTTPRDSTTLQLGYRNAPEDGVAIETQGAYSSMAASSMSNFSSLNSTVSALGSYLTSGRVSSVAESPIKLGSRPSVLGALNAASKITTTLSTIIKGATAVASLTVEGIEFDRKRDELDRKKKSIEKQKDALAAEKARKEQKAKTEAELAALRESVTDSQALKDAEAAYLAEKAQYEADLVLHRTNTEWLTEAKKGEWVRKEGDAVEFTGESAAQVEYLTLETEASTKAIHGDPEGEDEAAQKGSKLRYEEARAAYLASLKDAMKADGKSDDDCEDALSGAEDAIEAEDAAEETAATTWADADVAKNDYNTKVGLNENGEEAQELNRTKFALGVTETASGLAEVLVSDIIGILTAVFEMREAIRSSKEDSAAKLSAVASRPRKRAAIAGAFGAGPLSIWKYLKSIKNTLGSEGDTEVYADETLNLWAKNAVMFAKERTVVQSEDLLALLSQGNAELAAHDTAMITGEKVDVRADASVLIKSTPRAPMAGPGTITLESKDKTSITSKKSDIAMKAKEALSGEAKQVNLHARRTAELLAGSGANPEWGLKVDGAGKSVTLGHVTGQWKLTVKNNKVELGGPSTNLTLNATTSRLQASASSYVRVNQAKGEIVSTNVDLRATGNATVNGQRILLG